MAATSGCSTARDSLRYVLIVALPVCVSLPAAAGKGARSASLSDDEALLVKGLGLLTLKPLIYAANVSEDDLGNHGANNVHVQVRKGD